MAESKYFPDLTNGEDVADVTQIEDAFTLVEEDIEEVKAKVLTDDVPVINSTNLITSGAVASVQLSLESAISNSEGRLSDELEKKANLSDVYTKTQIDTQLADKADIHNSMGGFEGGDYSNATSGAAIGASANANSGGAVGNSAYTVSGGAVGENAYSGYGFAGGYNAKTGDSIQNAIQLGEGTNNSERTLQVYDYQLMDADGHIPNDRMPTKADKSISVPHTTVSGYPIALTDHLGGESILDYKIYGNSVQNGTPTADAPVDIQSVGDLVTDTASEYYGKYDIPITLCGDNLFDTETILPEQGWTKQEDGSFYVAVNRTVYQKKLWENTEGYTGRLKIDYRVKFQKGKAESGAGSSIRIIYTDGTAENVLLTSGTWEANQWIVPDYHVYSNANKVVAYLDWVYGTGGNPTWVKDIIITKNLSAEYEPFSGETKHIYLDEPLRKVGNYADYIDMKAQKVIRNVSVTDTTGTKTIAESLAGTETPTEESAVIPSLTMPVSAAANMTVKTTVVPSKADLEYYQDINKVIAEIKAAILSNGGNV